MRRVLTWSLTLLVVLGLLAGVALLVMQSAWFHRQVREKVIATIEEITGAKAEFGDYTFDWRALKVAVQPFVLHGKEESGRDPLFRASQLTMRFRVLSLFTPEIDLREFVVVKPEVHIYVAADGTTNFPTPRKAAASSNPVEQILRLAIERIELRDGIFEFDSRKIPLSVVAKDLQLGLDYETIGPRYRGHLIAAQTQVQGDIPVDLETRFALSAHQILVESAKVEIRNSRIELTGLLEDLANPNVSADFQAAINLADWPLRPVQGGRATVRGHATWTPDGEYNVAGQIASQAITVSNDHVVLDDTSLNSSFVVTPTRIELTDADLQGLGGSWRGKVTLTDLRRLAIEGDLQDLDLREIAVAARQADLPWTGHISGPAQLTGLLQGGSLTGIDAKALLDVTPVEGQLPVTGQVDVAFSQADGKIRLGNSSLRTGDSRVTFRGALGEHLDVGVWTTNSKDLEAVVRLIARDPNWELPITLDAGEARFEGAINGPLSHLDASGHVLLRRVVWEGVHLDRFEADVRATENQLSLTRVALAQRDARLSGAVRIALNNWKPDLDKEASAFFASRGIDLERLLKANEVDFNATGSLNLTARLDGSLKNPRGEVRLRVENAQIEGEKFRRVTTNLQYTGGASDKFQGTLQLDNARVNLAGDFQHAPGDWGSGSLQMQARIEDLDLHTSERAQLHVPGLGGRLHADTRFRVDLLQRKPNLHAVDGSLSIDSLVLRDEQLGDFLVTAKTENTVLRLQASSGLRNTRLNGNATVALTGQHLAEGSLTLTRLPFRLLTDLAAREPLPVRGFLQGSATFKGPLFDWKQGQADVTVSEIRIRPQGDQVSQVVETQLDTSELTIRNQGPLRLTVDAKGVRAASAEFVAKDTSLKLQGGYLFGARNPWDLRADGKIDLALLSTFRPDLTATGSSVVSASLRGAATDPQLSGRMELRGASFYLTDIPNGIEEANAVILFDRNRATIETLTGRTGGGNFEMAGFVSFAAKDFIFRLQAKANQVRLRYPEGVSNLLDADVSLTGSFAKSLLTGIVTVSRTGFNPRSDFASMLREPTKPVPGAVARNQFLQGLQFDIRIRTAPNAVFQSAFTNELQAEADLRLRGSPVKPIVLGSLKANQGEVNLFGNRYTVTRGEVLFYNTATIQPSLDFDVETRVRGFTVYINVNGPVERLNVNYRSEPPLQTNEIIALLTVGRSPTSTAGIPSSPSLQRGNMLENSPNTLLGGALSSALTSRVEKFFGASRIKIDPQVTGLEGVSQSRLTVEQSISRDVVVTFSTNLQRTQQQIITVEWDLNKEWAAVVTRDENGAFSLEFRLRKRFR